MDIGKGVDEKVQRGYGLSNTISARSGWLLTSHDGADPSQWHIPRFSPNPPTASVHGKGTPILCTEALRLLACFSLLSAALKAEHVGRKLHSMMYGQIAAAIPDEASLVATGSERVLPLPRSQHESTAYAYFPDELVIHAFSQAPHQFDASKIKGSPHPSLLPRGLVKEATQHVLADESIALPALLYGPDAGDLRLREALARWLSDFYAPEEPIDVARITITGGASQNLGCVLQTFTDPIYTRNVWIVSPTYMLLFRILDDAGLHHKLRAVPEDDEGIDIEYLRRELEKSEQKARTEGDNHPVYKPSRPWSKFYKHLIYAVPTFSNPSSKTMSLLRRQQLVRLAREYDALIITDDVYDQLQWQSSASSLTTPTVSPTPDLRKAQIPRLVDIDRTLDGGAHRPTASGFGNAASNGSFSKILGPGVRTGWIEGTPKFAYGVSQTGTSRSGGAPSHLTATFIARLLETGALQKHIFTCLQPSYRRRHCKMLEAIGRHLVPLGARLPQEDREIVGGYFIWVRLPVDAAALAKRAKEAENLVVAEGAIFEVPGDKEVANFPNEIRLCFAWEDEERLAEGVERLASLVKLMLVEESGRDDGQASRPNAEGVQGEEVSQTTFR